MIPRMSSVDLVQRALMQGLLRGELPPGTRLPQGELAARHGVSTVPVREAMQRLAGLGLLRLEPNRGAVVPHLSAAEAEEQYALRRGIEPQLLRRAIPRLTIVDLAQADLALAAGQDASLTEANWRFHQALYRAAGWDRGLAVVELLHASVAPYVVLYTQGLGRAGESQAQHVEMLEASRAGDVDRAVAALADHLDHAEAALVAWLRRAT